MVERRHCCELEEELRDKRRSFRCSGKVQEVGGERNAKVRKFVSC